MKFKYHILLALIFVLTCSAVPALEIDWVLVDDPNNEADETGFGKVDYSYLIGMYEITNQQYGEFLNAVAKEDTYSLYNSEMSSSKFGGIERSGERGGYEYTIKEGREKHPVNFVSWYNCLRFINWLQNGMPEGKQDISTTEDGAYTFDGPENVGARNKDAVFFLPSEDEWYKAAYYKGGSQDAGYWLYATQDNNQPAAEKPPGGYNSANSSLSPTDDSTQVGAYSESFSAYGTFDQTGNVSEWTETRFENLQWCIRGGSFDGSAKTMESSVRNRNDVLHSASWSVGFRVAALNEN